MNSEQLRINRLKEQSFKDPEISSDYDPFGFSEDLIDDFIPF